MKCKTYEKFQDAIDYDSAWRTKELINIKQLICNTDDKILIKAGFALLSAHLEGFLKEAAKIYINYVCSQSIPLSCLNTNFIAMHTYAAYLSCNETKKISSYGKFVNNVITSHLNAPFSVSWKRCDAFITTHGNPSSSVVNEILLSLGLDTSPYETKMKYLDGDLLINRNKIVHGEKIDLSKEDFLETYDNVTEIIRIFKYQLLDMALKKGYLISPDTNTQDPNTPPHTAPKAPAAETPAAAQLPPSA